MKLMMMKLKTQARIKKGKGGNVDFFLIVDPNSF